MLEGLILGLSVLVVIFQVPGGKIWAKNHLWAMDLATMLALFWIVITIRSTSIAVSAAVAGLTITIGLRLWKWLWLSWQ